MLKVVAVRLNMSWGFQTILAIKGQVNVCSINVQVSMLVYIEVSAPLGRIRAAKLLAQLKILMQIVGASQPSRGRLLVRVLP